MFGFFSKKCLGIDIGASSIKIVEISRFGKKKKLENYAEFQLPLEEKKINLFHKDTLGLLSDQVSEILKAVLKRARIKKRKVAFSLPDFATFFTTFDLPPMTEVEVPQAVEFEARHHIPVPLSEVSFDWQIIKKEKVLPGVKLKILLVAIPNQVLRSYQQMASLAGLEVEGMEAEIFGLIRSSIPSEIRSFPVCLVDIGWESTTVSITKDGFLRSSHSFDLSSNDFTNALMKKLHISYKEAEDLKKESGLNPENKEVFLVLSEQASFLGRDIESVCRDFEKAEKEKVDYVILSGGTSTLFGLREYLQNFLKRKVRFSNPFSQLSFPQALKPRIEELAPSFGVAVGVAMRGVDNI